MPSSVRHPYVWLPTCLLAALPLAWSPPGAVNKKAVLDSTPHSKPATYAKSVEDYNQHMIDRNTQGRSKSLHSGKEARPGRMR
jgi:hypothetical protein